MEQATWDEMSVPQKNALKKINGDFHEETKRMATKCAWAPHSVTSTMRVFHNLLGIEKTYDGSQISLNCAVNFVAHLTDENCDNFVRMVDKAKAFEVKGQETENKMHDARKEAKKAEEMLHKIKARSQKEQRRLVAENLVATTKIGLYRRQALVTMLSEYSHDSVAEITLRLANEDLEEYVERLNLGAPFSVKRDEEHGSFKVYMDKRGIEFDQQRQFNELINHWGWVNDYIVSTEHSDFEDED